MGPASFLVCGSRGSLRLRTDLGARGGHHGREKITFVQSGPIDLAGKGLGLLQAGALDLFPMVVDRAVEPQEMEAGGLLADEILAQVQAHLPFQGLTGAVDHLHRQVEAVAVAFKGVGLDEGQAFGAGAGKFQSPLVAVLEAEPPWRGLT